jgi:peptidyl-prolyl cis-trans isomerase-like 3
MSHMPQCNMCAAAVFGHVIDGLDTLDRMEKVPADAADRPKTDIVLKGVTIHANPMAI